MWYNNQVNLVLVMYVLICFFVKSVVLRLIEAINVKFAENKFTHDYYLAIWSAVKPNELRTYDILVCRTFTFTDADSQCAINTNK